MNQFEVRQSQEPVLIDEIVPGSVQQIENTLIAISSVTGLIVLLARFKAAKVRKVETAASGKKRLGRPRIVKAPVVVAANGQSQLEQVAH